MPEYRIDDFRFGMQRDTFSPEQVSLYTIKNYLIDYTGAKPRLKTRKGYTRFNTTALAEVCTQLFVFRDLSNNEHILGILAGAEDSWYVIKATGSHVELQNAIATAPCPIVGFGDRVFFGTDSYFYWTDDAAINGATKSFRTGIQKPDGTLQVETVAAEGHTDAAGVGVVLNPTTQRKIAIEFTPTAKQVLASITVSMRRYEARQDLSGSVRWAIYTDNGGEPSTDLADPDATSRWILVSHLSYGSYAVKNFYFPDRFELDAGTKYFIVLEGDDAYYANYRRNLNPNDFYAVVGCENAPGSYKYGQLQLYDNGAGSWSQDTYEAHFYIGGLTADQVYDYVMTYYNSSYGSESRPSANARVEATTTKPVVWVRNYPTTSDGQVDKLRFYRREVPAMDSEESAITDAYKLVKEVDIWLALIDTIPTDYLGTALQTTDHYCYDDTDDTNSGKRDSGLHPNAVAVWKDRIWVAELEGNILYMSKLLEEDGATGWTGKAIPDYFPLDNKLEIPEPSDIIALRQLSDDQLVVYFRNGAVWIVEGGNEVLNPPSDFEFRQVLTNTGLIALRGLAELRGRHIYMAQEGIHSFFGTPNPEYLSQPIQSILDDIQTGYLDDTVITSFGDEIWVLVDDDNDGNKESIYVLDIQRNIPAWRKYDYGVNLNDIVVRPTGSTFKTLLAADADNKYILELQSGTDDNGQAIETEIETHDLTVADRLSIIGVELDGYYPSVPAAYTVVVRDHIGDERSYRIEPKSRDDVRGHRTGCLVTTGPKARVRVEGRSVNEDELLSLAVKYIER